MSLAHRILELEKPPLERDGVVEEEPRGVLEAFWEGITREILKERVRGIGKQEGNVPGWGSRGKGRQNGEGIGSTESDVRDSAIDKDKNSSGRIEVALDLSCNTLPLECGLVKMVGVGEPRCV